jgi:hypothetical protein
MLGWLTKRLRVRAAIALAALYAACVMAPPLALAFADGAAAAHCLTDDHHAATHRHSTPDAHQHGGVHRHADGAVHKHADDAGTSMNGGEDEPTSTTGSCCGLFCFAATTGDLPEIGQPVHASSVLPALDEHLAGRGPERINRPPITLASL